jgi:ferritin heavy chain
MASVVRQNYHQECEAGINKQVNMELHAHYVYLSMAMYFDRDDVALPGFAKYFKTASAEEAEHAEKFMKFQNSRGGRVLLKEIPKPEQDEWGSPLDAMKAALELEKTVNQSIIDLHAVAGDKADGNMTDFLEDFLQEQVEGIKAIADLVTRVTRAGPGLGEVIIDKELAA